MSEGFREIAKRWNKIAGRIDQLKLELDSLLDTVDQKRRELDLALSRRLELARYGGYREEEMDAFLNEPYAILPRGRDHPNEWWVVTPKFSNFQLGYLDHTSNGWNYFVVNKYIKWLTPLPEELKKKFKFGKILPLKVYDDMLLTGEAHQDEAWYRYRKYLAKRKGTDQIYIKRGCEFDLIAQIIDDGMLPFAPQAVDEVDLKEPQINFSLRDYQEEWWRSFLKWGANGVFAPFGSGKTYLGLYAIASLKGRKLVVVPTRGLIDQWKERLNGLVRTSEDVDVVTYRSYRKIRENEYVLAIHDECHRLPANQFSRMATVRTKYRLGLSGTPYREDGRTNYIFALTGNPLSLAWNKFFDLEIVAKPTITLYLFSHYWYKERKLDELLARPKKTIIFVWRIDVGKRLQKAYKLPFVYGGTSGKARLEIIRNSEQVIVSSVGSEGISVPDLERVIEFDWLGRSRREEAQRMGRLFHSEERNPEHIILMTDKEFERDEQRLYSIYEKGFRINVVR